MAKTTSAAFALASLLAAAACGVGGNRNVSRNATPTPTPPAVESHVPSGFKPSAEKARDAGDFKYVYSPVKNKKYAGWRRELMQERVLEEIAGELNKQLALPEDVTLSFDQCGEVNAYYDPERRRVSLCYELLEDLYRVFEEEAESQEELDDEVAGATVFVFFHELGHALVHVLELPITGREEDAVDQLSTFLVTDGTEEGAATALDAARSFYADAEAEEGGEPDYWNEHSLNRQRFYNIICWVYGQNPERYASLVGEGVLPEERASRCGAEYEQIERAWTTLLRPHLKSTD
ncbi:MAG TPA: DUF4344 domain-containing metallopeptidase [Pyrinomonadaceae bacterium]|nr:DUF4344 domain-containing metallopeptidase [Pyrinomonadaceae bacterium]